MASAHSAHASTAGHRRGRPSPGVAVTAMVLAVRSAPLACTSQPRLSPASVASLRLGSVTDGGPAQGPPEAPTNEQRDPRARLAIRFSVGCALIIPMIIQTILLDPSRAIWTDEASNVSRPDPSGADQVDAEHPSRNRKVVGSNPTSGSKAQVRALQCSLCLGPVNDSVDPPTQIDQRDSLLFVLVGHDRHDQQSRASGASGSSSLATKPKSTRTASRCSGKCSSRTGVLVGEADQLDARVAGSLARPVPADKGVAGTRMSRTRSTAGDCCRPPLVLGEHPIGTGGGRSRAGVRCRTRLTTLRHETLWDIDFGHGFCTPAERLVAGEGGCRRSLRF